MSPEEKFIKDLIWVLKEIKTESLAIPPGGQIDFELRSPSDSDKAIPSYEDQRRIMRALENCGAINIIQVHRPRNSLIYQIYFSENQKPDGYTIQLIQPRFDQLYKEPALIHKFIQESKPETMEGEVLELLGEMIEWSEEFDWDKDTFVFGKYGEIDFSSDNRKSIFKLLTDAKGDWVSVNKLKGDKDSNYLRATIRQIEERMDTKLKKHVSIPSTTEDNAGNKPSQGAYRIKFVSKPAEEPKQTLTAKTSMEESKLALKP